MNYYLLAAGISLSLINLYDFVYTTLSANGVGWITGKLSRGLWKVFLFICRNRGKNPIFNHSGMITVVLNLCTWITLTWVGHTLIMLSDPVSVVDPSTRLPAKVVEKFYYTGDVLSTVGNGEFISGTPFWQIYTVFIALSGLTILTIAITYLVQVLTAEISKRQLSLYIATLGGTPQSILLNGWDGKDFKKLERDFAGLSTMVLAHSQNHLAYPILHHFHSSNLKESSCINLTALDEALTILKVCIPEMSQPSKLDVGSLRKSLTTYLLTLDADFITSSDRPLPIPDLSELQQEGIPLINDPETIEAAYKKLNPRRKLLRALLENDGWRWGDLNQPKFRSELDL